jgi:hypothetical protein
MLPDIRFAIGAVLASALLIVTAFGLAATVRVAHHKTGGPLEAPRILAYADPIDWGPRPDALRRLDDFRINDPLLERLAAIPVDPPGIRLSDPTPTADREPAGEPLVIARPMAALPPAAISAEVPSIATPDVVAETPVAPPPIAVVAEVPAARVPEAKPVEAERASPARVAALLTADNVAAKADPGAALLRVAVPPPAKKAAANVKKKVAKARRAPQRAVVRQPIASTGYPVTGGDTGFGNRGFGNGGFGNNSFDNKKYSDN